MTTLQAVKGMNDVLPDQSGRWRALEERFVETALRYGFAELRTPVVEPTELFVRSIGEATDIVEKEMYTFSDKADRSLTLRPEGTASAVRAYLEHSVYAREPVTKWVYVGPMFRRERPAKGRYRQFHQLGAEVLGDPGPYVDAELIDMGVTFLRSVGVRDLDVLVNSLGSPSARERYRIELVNYLQPHRDRLSADSRRRLETNPLRVLDSKAEEDQAVVAGAPTIVDFIDDEDRAHLEALCGTLRAFGTPFRVEPRLVRGLDYYGRTLFEVQGRSDALGAQNAIFGGGRYDELVASLGGPATPAIGFAIGIERLLLASEDSGLSARPMAFVVATEPSVRTDAALLARELRAAGLSADADLRGQSLKSQLRRANKLQARFVLLIGPDELAQDLVMVKHFEEKTQVSVSRSQVVPYLRAAATQPLPVPQP